MDNIIIQHYAKASFMYDKNHKMYDHPEVKFIFYKELQEKLSTTLIIQITVEEIKKRWSDLRQFFCKTDNKYLRKETVTYWESQMYRRLYFLKPYIKHHFKETKKNKFSSSIENNKIKSTTAFEKMRCTSSIGNYYENKTTLREGNEKSSSKFNKPSSSKFNEVASSKFKRKVFLNDSAASLHHCAILNDAIKSLPTTKLKMIRLQKIIRSIDQFSKRQMK